MALKDFFRINLPYGLKRNDKDEWFAFNREYKPLGWNTTDFINEFEYPVYTLYKGLTDKLIIKMFPDSHYHRNDNGIIDRIFFYDDSTNPQSNPKYWKDYFEIIKELSKLKSVEK
jgi:hypothetical protein